MKPVNLFLLGFGLWFGVRCGMAIERNDAVWTALHLILALVYLLLSQTGKRHEA